MTFLIQAPSPDDNRMVDKYLKNEFAATYISQPSSFSDVPGGQQLICIIRRFTSYWPIAVTVDSAQEFAELLTDTVLQPDDGAPQKTWMLIATGQNLPGRA